MNKTFELLGILGALILPGEYNLMSVAQWPAHGKLQLHNKILSTHISTNRCFVCFTASVNDYPKWRVVDNI